MRKHNWEIDVMKYKHDLLESEIKELTKLLCDKVVGKIYKIKEKHYIIELILLMIIEVLVFTYYYDHPSHFNYKSIIVIVGCAALIGLLASQIINYYLFYTKIKEKIIKISKDEYELDTEFIIKGSKEYKLNDYTECVFTKYYFVLFFNNEVICFKRDPDIDNYFSKILKNT